jgi:hypothetical protein
MQLPTLRRTTWLALASIAVGLAAVLVAIFSDRLDGWMTNVATDALLLAFTILIVERIVRGEAEARLRPRREMLFHSVGLRFRSFMSGLTLDYAQTHLSTFRPIPDDAQAMIEQWIADREAEDTARVPLEGDTLPWLFLEARNFIAQLEGYRERDREIMEPDFIAAIDTFGWRFQQALTLMRVQREVRPDDAAAAADAERVGLDALLRGARGFAAVLARYAPEWMELPAIMREGARSHSEQLRAVRANSAGD